jgi:tripartite-type tricarboxylate transporter receptor subunit TctC
MRTRLNRFALLAVAILGIAPDVAVAQATMPKTMRIVVPFSAGGSNDVVARAIAGPLGKRLDAAVIVENKAGAAGVIGADFVAKSPKDGSVLLLTSSSFLTAAATQTQLPYDPIAAFAPVAMIGRGPMLLAVSATTPMKSPSDLVAAARAAPGALNYGTAGVGSIAHLTTQMLDDAANIRMTHVPYKGASNAAVDLAGGQIQVMVSNYSTIAPLMKSGKIRALAVTTKDRLSVMPDVPTLQEAGVPGYELAAWQGVIAPAGTPRPIVDRLNAAIVRLLHEPETARRLTGDGGQIITSTPEEFAAYVRSEIGRFASIVKASGAKVE